MGKKIIKAVVMSISLTILAVCLFYLFDNARGHQARTNKEVSPQELPRTVAAADQDASKAIGNILQLIAGGGDVVAGGIGVNEFTLRHRKVQINKDCLNHDLAVKEGDSVVFSPFSDTVFQGTVHHVQTSDDEALCFTVVIAGVPATQIDVTIFKGRISIRYDNIASGKRYLIVRTEADSQYIALEIDCQAERVARQEKIRRELELARDGAETNSMAAGRQVAREVIPDAPDGRTLFGGSDFMFEQLPECRFKRDLMALDQDAKAYALASLRDGRISFHKNDLPDLYVDKTGAINYACSFFPMIEPDVASEGEASVPAIADASVPVSSPPIRHSKEGAANVLFLDFNGHYMAAGETYWANSTYSTWSDRPGETVDQPPWDCLAWSDDADRTQFNDAEQEFIIGVWARIAEDYAPFDVDVTTEFPGAWGPTVGHCLFTPTTDGQGKELPHLATGGRAYLSVFGNSAYSYDSPWEAFSPAFVATSGSLSYYYAEAGAHELGHNMGLSHDGDSTQPYYDGHRILSGDSHTWNTIMGGGVTPDVGQWSKGDYFDANQFQDDLAIIDGRLGYRSDDHGDDIGTASGLNVLGDLVTVSDSGVIEHTDDPDVFSFSTGAGQISLNAATYKRTSSDWGANLDILLELRNSAGDLVATNNPANDLFASITLTVAQGTYYLYVKPTGVANPTGNPPYGYTSYGSLGFYAITGSILPTNENDTDGDGMPNDWETLYFGGPTNAVAGENPDNDFYSNIEEYIAGLNPTNFDSFGPSTLMSSGSNMWFSWTPVTGRVYSVYWTSNLLYGFSLLQSNLTSGVYTDTVHSAEQQGFYRMGVELAP